MSGPRMMPGQEPYTPEEVATLEGLVASAAAGDPGEEGEAEVLRNDVRTIYVCEVGGREVMRMVMRRGALNREGGYWIGGATSIAAMGTFRWPEPRPEQVW